MGALSKDAGNSSGSSSRASTSAAGNPVPPYSHHSHHSHQPGGSKAWHTGDTDPMEAHEFIRVQGRDGKTWYENPATRQTLWDLPRRGVVTSTRNFPD